jgi:hypothetical protein
MASCDRWSDSCSAVILSVCTLSGSGGDAGAGARWGYLGTRPGRDVPGHWVGEGTIRRILAAAGPRSRAAAASLTGRQFLEATLAQQDGTRPRVWNDFYRVRDACQAAE